MQKNPKISVIVPIYNAEKDIERCIASIYAQTFTDYEIILVNDGSNDNSASICKNYKEKDDRITFIDKKNEGAGSARNAGIEAAKGDYFVFPDVDDWFESNMFEELYKATLSGKYDVVFSGANFYSQGNENDVIYSRSAICEKVSFSTQKECRRNVMTFFPTSTIFDVPWNKLYKRSVIIDNNIRFSDARRCQDAIFNIDFYDVIQSATSVDKAYYNYIENTLESVQRKFPKNYIDINVKYFSTLINHLLSWGIYKGNIKQHYDNSFVNAIYETMEMFENPVWNLSKKEQMTYVKNIMSKCEIQNMLKEMSFNGDVRIKADIIKNQNYIKFRSYYQLKKLKDNVRKNKMIMRLYHRLRDRK